MSLLGRAAASLRWHWPRLWMRLSGPGPLGRLATRVAAWGVPPYKGRVRLAQHARRGYVAPSAALHHPALRMGAHVFVGERVVVYQTRSGSVELGDGVHLYGDIVIETGDGGAVVIGPETHVQPGCRFSGYRGTIHIGARVEIAPNCAFYPYDHGVAAGVPIREQPLVSRGGIRVGDDVWIGVGAVLLDGVTVGDGAVIGAGSVVTRDVPAGAIAAGAPARVLSMRGAAVPPEAGTPAAADRESMLLTRGGSA